MAIERTLNSGYLSRDVGIFEMFRYYWSVVLNKTYVSDRNFKIALLGTGDGTEKLPISLAIEGKSKQDISQYRLNPDLHPLVGAVGMDYDLEDFNKLMLTPHLHHFFDMNNFIQADNRVIPIQDTSFDIVVMRNPYWDDFAVTPEGQPNKYDLKALAKQFSELDRVLKPNGLLWMTFLSKSEYKVGNNQVQGLVNRNNYSNLISGRSGFQTYPGINPETKKPWPYDKYIIVAEKN
jgi:hypothetical protein